MAERARAHEYDVVVIGGGFAGATAARDLGQAGYCVVVLEARDRLGGRTWYRPFAGTAQWVELGGTWIAPRWQPHMAREIARYGLAITESPDPVSLVSLVGGQRLSGVIPVPTADVYDLERLLYHTMQAAHRLDSRAPLVDPPPDLDVSISEFLAPLRLSPAVHDFATAWAEGICGCASGDASALTVLAWIAAYDYSIAAIHLGESEMFAAGTSSAIAALMGNAGAEVRLSAPVRRVAQDDRGVAVTTHGGETVTARAAVVAVPLNCLADLEFAPALGAVKQAAAAEGHVGRATKVWALVRGAPPYFLGAGRGPGLVWLGTQRELPEGSVMVGFGPGPDVLDVGSAADVQRNLDAYAPGARVLRIDAHDWNADPYAKGAWAAYRPGQLTRFGAALRAPEGRLAFATSDIAPRWAGWIEGAIASGTLAASHVAALLAGPRV